MNAGRFWSHVHRGSECWLWQGYLNELGYGRVKIAGRHRYAHRVAWELTHGPIREGAWIRQNCGQRACCRPEHLYLQTVHRLSSADIKRIARCPLGIKMLARMLGVSWQRISVVRRQLAGVA